MIEGAGHAPFAGKTVSVYELIRKFITVIDSADDTILLILPCLSIEKRLCHAL